MSDEARSKRIREGLKLDGKVFVPEWGAPADSQRLYEPCEHGHRVPVDKPIMQDCGYVLVPKAMIEAAEQHVQKGHNDTCSYALCGPGYKCDCGYDTMRAYLALRKKESSL